MQSVSKDLLQLTSYKVLGKLPDLLTFDNGDAVKTAEDWEKRRAEIFRTAVELQFGTMPPAPEFLEAEILCNHKSLSCRIYTGKREKPITFYMKVILPKQMTGKSCPVIIDGDMCFDYHLTNNFISAATDEGVAWALFDRTELAHDTRDGRRGQIYETYPEYTFGAVGAWAWGYSRCVDALEKLFGDKTEPEIDLSAIAFTGHSRGGKTAALAGALDKRAAVVNPNQSGMCGCGCYRIQMRGYCGGIRGEMRSEVLRDDITQFPYWTGPGLAAYMDREQELPFDCHFLKALIAPRILYTSDAAGDIWANPIGAWMTNMAAKKAWELLGAENNLYWSYREGTHSHTAEDIKMLVGIIKHHTDPSVPLPNGLFLTPFEPPALIF